MRMDDWSTARQMGKRVFYERSTQTIRACPENYCLAHRNYIPGGGWKWQRYGDDNATRNWWPIIDKTIETWAGGSTGDALATAIGKAISGTDRRAQ